MEWDRHFRVIQKHPGGVKIPAPPEEWILEGFSEKLYHQNHSFMKKHSA
jgi:hypothetical protein